MREEWLTKMDGWGDIEHQGELYSMQKHRERGKCKVRQKNQVPEKVSWWLQMLQIIKCYIAS